MAGPLQQLTHKAKPKAKRRCSLTGPTSNTSHVSTSLVTPEDKSSACACVLKSRMSFAVTLQARWRQDYNSCASVIDSDKQEEKKTEKKKKSIA